MNRRSLMLLVLICSIATACGSSSDGDSASEEDAVADAEEDAVNDGVAGMDGSSSDGTDGTSCPEIPCPAGQMCTDGMCTASETEPSPCATSADCTGDTQCDGAVCVPWGDDGGFDFQCGVPAPSGGVLAPLEPKCVWAGGNVRSAPVVGDIDGTPGAEIAFLALETPGSEEATLRVLRGGNCAPLFAEPVPLDPTTQLAIADLDGDGMAEIIGVDAAGFIYVYDRFGQLIARSDDPASFLGSDADHGGPTVANLDGDGAAEIVYGGLAVTFFGGELPTLHNRPASVGVWGGITVVGELDGDSTPEMVVGPSIIDGRTGDDETPELLPTLAAGLTAVADFDASEPGDEVVLVSMSADSAPEVVVYSPRNGAIVFGPIGFGTQGGGAPVVADFDGDGAPEIAASSSDVLAVFDADCEVDPLPDFCARRGVRWQQPVRGSGLGVLGASAFDFNGDGAAEVLMRDTCWLRIYEGKTGAIRSAASVTSGGWMDLPVVANVDGDEAAEVVIAADASIAACDPESTLGLDPLPPARGVLIFDGADSLWAPARSVWHQHAYSAEAIADDLSVPPVLGAVDSPWNTFRAAVVGLELETQPTPDLTARWEPSDSAPSCDATWILRAQICNRGSVATEVAPTSAFFRGDPSDEQRLCDANANTPLAPGECVSVACAHPDPSPEPFDLHFAADLGDDIAECLESNNGFAVLSVACEP